MQNRTVHAIKFQAHNLRARISAEPYGDNLVILKKLAERKQHRRAPKHKVYGYEHWNPAEDRRLIQLLKVHGKDWDTIADNFISRTKQQILNRVQRLKKQLVLSRDPEDQAILKLIASDI